MTIEELRKEVPELAAFLEKIGEEEIQKLTDEQILFGDEQRPSKQTSINVL